MSSREEFLRAVEDEDTTNFVRLMQLHASKKELFDVDEVLVELSKKQLEEVWAALQLRCTGTLLSFNMDSNDDDQRQELKAASEHLQGIIMVAMATLAMKDVQHPQQMFETALVLHGVLLSLPDDLDRLRTAIARLCEAWWESGRDGREDLAPQTFMYLLQCSLDAATATGMDVKRVYSLRHCLEHINLENESSTTLRNLLQHAFISSNYLKIEQGKRFLAYLFGLNLAFIDTIHRTIKNHIPSSTNSTLIVYGELYFRAWKVAAGQFLEKLEQSCIQDLMYHAVHANRGGASRSLASLLRKVLIPIHQQKAQRGVDEMLLHLYQPIIWRSLKVANADVRANAASLLFDAFPLQDPQATNEENDALMQKQFDIFSSLLYDPSHTVRIIAVQGVCRACRVYWELIPAATIKALVLHLVQDLAWDSASADVRVAVVKGLTELLDNKLSHPLLKVALPELRNLLHDASERVRVSVVDMLLTVKGLRAIKFWMVVPMEHLLARLELDDSPVAKRITSLLYNSYLPIEKPVEVQIQRCISLIQSNPGAARRFYQYAPTHLGLDQTVTLILSLCKCVHICVKQSEPGASDAAGSGQGTSAKRGGRQRSRKNKENFERDCLESSSDEDTDATEKESGTETSQASTDTSSQTGAETSQASADTSQTGAETSQAGSTGGIGVEDVAVIAGLLETVLILWMSVNPQLNKAGSKDSKRRLQMRFSHILPPLFHAFHDDRILSSLIMLSGFLPPNTVPVVSRSLLSKLKALGADSDADTYGAMLEAICQWGKAGDVLELINDWLEAALKVTGVAATPRNKARKKKSVGFMEPVEPQPMLALRYLSYLTQHGQCRDLMILHGRNAATEVARTLSTVMRCLEKRFESAEALSELATDDFLVQAFEAYCKLVVVLHQQENDESNAVTVYQRESNAVTVYQRLVTWADVEIIRLLKKKRSSSHRRGKKLMGAADATLLANPSCDETTLQQTIADQTLLMSETLLNDTLLATGVKRSAGDGQAAVISELAGRVLQALVTVASNMLLVGVGDQELASHLADFSIQLLQVDESSEFLPVIAGLMYQITEMTLSADDTLAAGAGNIVPDMLTKVVQMLAQLCRHKKEQAQRVLPSIRPAFTEILTAYYRHHSLDETVGRDVMATVMAAVLSEITECIKKDAHFEECSAVSELPVLSAFLLGLVSRKTIFTSLFLCELCECMKSGAISSIEGRLAALHILHPLSAAQSTSEHKDCLLAVQQQVESNPAPSELSDDSPERHKYNTATRLTRTCMTNAGMVA